MHVFIATDIFGRTDAIEGLAQQFAEQDVAVTVVTPYAGHTFRHFPDERTAYSAFLEECGHARYADILLTSIHATDARVLAIGFSAGASALWHISDGAARLSLHHIIGFYPSQIRHALHIIPSCPVTLIFPCREAHFHLEPIMHRVSQLPHVACLKTGYLHGFMNPLSCHYSPHAATKCLRVLADVRVCANQTSFRQACHRAVGEGRPPECQEGGRRNAL
jgi:dienelactone hydrolase